VTTLVIAFLAVVAGGIFVALHYIGEKPPTVDYTSVASNGQVNVTMMTTPQTTVTDKPDWVSYFIQNPQTKQFVHTTYFEVPPLRNPVWGKVTGTAGNVEVTRYYNGKSYSAPQAISLLDSWADCSVQHTFAIPGLGLSVPVASPNTVAENNALCTTSPCVANTADQALAPHTVVRFSFKTPKAGGTFRWQCFVPCGGGFLHGNGGPMGTPGYMMGQMEVQA
jgi:hypothetical protein